MVLVSEEIDRVIEKFRDPSVSIMYHQVYNALHVLANKLCEQKIDDENGILSREEVAFALHIPDNGDQSSWGTSYGPWLESGGSEYPEKSCITESCLEFWTDRGQNETCSILAARYNDIVWDLAGIGGVGKSIDCAQRAIDSYCDSIKKDKFELGIEERKYLTRARSIAIQIRDSNRQHRVERLVVRREEMMAEDSKPGTWGNGFELLFKGSKSVLNDAERREILIHMESRLERLAGVASDDINPNSIDYIATLLIKYYSQMEDRDKCYAAVEALNEIFFEFCSTQDALVSHHWLSMYFHLLSDYGYANKGLGMSVQSAIQNLGPSIKSNLKESTRTETVSRDKVESVVEAITDETLGRALMNYGMYLFHDLNEVEEHLEQALAENSLPFSSLLCGESNLDHKGIVKSIVGPVDTDVKGNAVLTMTRMMIGEVALLADFSMRNIVQKYDVKESNFTYELYADSRLPEENREMIEKGIKFYLQEDYLSAIHILTPQIEACIRHDIQQSSGIVYQFKKDGSESCKTLGALLAYAEKAGIYDRKLVNYYSVVLLDSRGFNIRNSVAHGLNDKNFFCKTIADRLLHVLILVAMQHKIVEPTHEPDACQEPT